MSNSISNGFLNENICSLKRYCITDEEDDDAEGEVEGEVEDDEDDA